MNEEKTPHPYKIMPNDEIMVWRSEYGNNIFYKTQIVKTNYDKTKTKFYKNLRFAKGTDIPNGTLIKVIDMFEDVRENKADKYNPIWELFIKSYEIIESKEYDKSSAIEEYNNAVSESNIEITDDDLPF